MKHDTYEILIVPLPDADGGGFLAVVPDLQGCMADGATQEEALSNAHDAIEAWAEAQRDMGRDMPPPGSARQQLIKEDQALLETLHGQQELIDRLRKRIEIFQSRRGQVVFVGDAWTSNTSTRRLPH